MKTLLLISHGSRNPEFNKEIHELTTLLGARMANFPGQKFEIVSCAFLELADPGIDEGIDNLVKKGATEIVVLPYFLAKGNHVHIDIPAIISEARIRIPDIEIVTLPHVGRATGMPDLLLQHISDNKL